MAVTLCVCALFYWYSPALRQLWQAWNPASHEGEGGSNPPGKPFIYTGGPPLSTFPAETLRGPDGSEVTLPERYAADLGTVTWSAIETPPELRSISLAGKVLQFENNDSLGISGETTIDLPVVESDRPLTVLMRGSAPFWAPLKSTEVRLADGTLARRVVITDEPAPWTLVVSDDPAMAQLPADPVLAEMIRIESGMISSKSPPEGIGDPETNHAAKGRRQPRPLPAAILGGVLAQTPTADPSRIPWDPQDLKELYLASWKELNRAKYAYSETGSRLLRRQGHDPYVIGWRHYYAGIKQLSHLRKLPPQHAEGIWFEEWPFHVTPEGDLKNSGSVCLVRNALADMAAQYAPWGIDLTVALLDASGGPIRPLFDLRVLPPIGQLYFVDFALPAGVEFTDAEWQKEVGEQRTLFDRKDLVQTTFLRIFSPRTVNLSSLHQLVSFADDRALRWGPALLNLARFVGLVGASAGTGGLSVLGAFVWPAIEETLDLVMQLQDVDGQTYTRAQYGTVIGGEVADVLVKYAAGELQIGDFRHAPSAYFTKQKAAMLLLNAACAYFLEKLDDGYLKEIATIPTGRYSYRAESESFGQLTMPPILLVNFFVGREQDANPAAEHYPVFLGKSVVYHVDFTTLYRGNLTALIGAPSEMSIDPQSVPAQLPVSRYRPGRLAPAFRLDQTPHRQFVRFLLSRDLLEERIQQRGLTSTTWQDVPLNDLGWQVAMESQDHTFRFADELRDVTTAKDLQREARAAAVQIQQTGALGFGRLPIPAEYRVDTFQPLARPRRHYRFALVELDSAANDWRPATQPILVDLSRIPPASLQTSEVDFFQAKSEQAWLFLEQANIEPPLTLTLKVFPTSLDQALVGKEYRIQLEILGLPRGVRQIRYRYEPPDSQSTAQPVEITQNVDNRTATIQQRLQFSEPVTGMARVTLYDAQSGKPLGETLQLAVDAREIKKMPQLCFATEELGPGNPEPWLFPNMSGFEGGTPWACYAPGEHVVYAGNLQITGPGGQSIFLASQNPLRLQCRADGSILLPGTENDPTAYRGKVEPHRILLEVDYYDPARPDAPPIKAKWVFDK